jgi:hypothetical protein
MADTASQTRVTRRWVSVAFWVEVGLWLRVAAALVVEWAAQRRGVRCLFPDTEIYWELGRAIRAGGPYEISSWGVPHFSVRTPGYPLFLAATQTLFGERTLPARLLQAAIGAACVWIVARLVDRVAPKRAMRGGWSVATVAAALVAVEPYTVLNSAFLLSEAVFLPLMLLALWGLAELWSTQASALGSRLRFVAIAVVTGSAVGASIMVKPSWALFPPLALAVWLAAARGQRLAAVCGGLLIALGASALMAPWWIRNAEVYGRFIPTALWAGASLYDGLNPEATGASNMDFLNTPEMQPMDEELQDKLLLARARSFAVSHPERVLVLAAQKAARYWSPWPNADGGQSPIRYLGAVFTLPLYGLILVGAWACRENVRALMLLAGPLLYFAALHMIFVGALRYRVPPAVPAMGLAAIGVAVLFKRTAPAPAER